MAQNVKKILGTDLGIAVSGIAGPDGGTPEKPVGTVWIAVSDAKGTQAKKLKLTKNRELNIEASAKLALNLLRQRLLEMD
jgi:nicotinamide-nucleotide amidase